MIESKSMSTIEKMWINFKDFKHTYYEKPSNDFKNLLKNGQNPKTLVIACCDSRVDPAIIFGTNPGDIFVLRNIANIVPSYNTNIKDYSTFAALEFAVIKLKIKDIVILGHSNCAGIQALIDDLHFKIKIDQEFLKSWVNINKTCTDHNKDIETVSHLSIKNSLYNLLSFPFVEKQIQRGLLKIHGWWYEINKGELWYYNQKHKIFMQ